MRSTAKKSVAGFSLDACIGEASMVIIHLGPSEARSDLTDDLRPREAQPRRSNPYFEASFGGHVAS